MTALERVTVGVPARDVSAPDSNSSTAPSAYSPGVGGLVEEAPCSCGGTVRASVATPQYGVTAHQFTGRHKAWRDAHDLGQYGEAIR